MGIIMEHADPDLFNEGVENSLFPSNYVALRYACEKCRPLKVGSFTWLWAVCKLTPRVVSC